MNKVVDLAVTADGAVVAVAPAGVASLYGTGGWTSIDVEDLPEGTPGIGWLDRYIVRAAAGPDGSLWVAGYARSRADDEQFGGAIDGWSGGRTLEWIARYHCPVCGEWTVWTANEVPELSGGIGDLVVSSDDKVYASVGEDLLMVFDGFEWKSYVAPLPTVSSGAVAPWSSSLAVGIDGVVWAATNHDGWGVVAFDGSGFTRYTSEDGVPGGRVFQVESATDGRIWVATDVLDDSASTASSTPAARIASFDGTTWTTYTNADGLLSNDAVIATGTDGTVWAVHSEIPPYGYGRFDGTQWTAYPFDLPVGGFRANVGPDGTLWTVSDGGYLVSFDGATRTVRPSPFDQAVGFLTFAPVQWGIILDDPDWDPGIHTAFMIVDARPLTVDLVEDVSGRLIWGETVVELCGISIREEGDGSLHIGDIFQTSEGCGNNPSAMQAAFDEFGLPETACVTVTSGGLDHDYCASMR